MVLWTDYLALCLLILALLLVRFLYRQQGRKYPLVLSALQAWSVLLLAGLALFQKAL
jgi:hypothetical protein